MLAERVQVASAQSLPWAPRRKVTWHSRGKSTADADGVERGDWYDREGEHNGQFVKLKRRDKCSSVRVAQFPQFLPLVAAGSGGFRSIAENDHWGRDCAECTCTPDLSAGEGVRSDDLCPSGRYHATCAYVRARDTRDGPKKIFPDSALTRRTVWKSTALRSQVPIYPGLRANMYKYLYVSY